MLVLTLPWMDAAPQCSVSERFPNARAVRMRLMRAQPSLLQGQELTGGEHELRRDCSQTEPPLPATASSPDTAELR